MSEMSGLELQFLTMTGIMTAAIMLLILAAIEMD